MLFNTIFEWYILTLPRTHLLEIFYICLLGKIDLSFNAPLSCTRSILKVCRRWWITWITAYIIHYISWQHYCLSWLKWYYNILPFPLVPTLLQLSKVIIILKYYPKLVQMYYFRLNMCKFITVSSCTWVKMSWSF